MNELMRELELEAIAYADSKVPADNRYNDIYHSIVRRLMAELVVRYCAEIALQSGNITNKSEQAKIEAQRIYHKIQDQFGD
jgi:hypothetical protein